MKFCDECRVKNQWPRNKAFPYVGLIPYGQCEVCRKYDQLNNVPVNELKPKETQDEKRVDNMRQIMYRNLAEELAIYWESGPRAGQINEQETAELKRIFVWTDSGKTTIDWYATYELRLVARNGAQAKHLKSKGA